MQGNKNLRTDLVFDLVSTSINRPRSAALSYECESVWRVHMCGRSILSQHTISIRFFELNAARLSNFVGLEDAPRACMYPRCSRPEYQRSYELRFLVMNFFHSPNTHPQSHTHKHGNYFASTLLCSFSFNN